MSDEELVAHADAPPGLARALYAVPGHSSRPGRWHGRSSLPQPVDLAGASHARRLSGSPSPGGGARPLRRGRGPCDRPRAEGGRRRPAGATAGADGRRARPELWSVVAALPAPALARSGAPRSPAEPRLRSRHAPAGHADGLAHRALPPPEPVGVYVCGPTVYARAHIGTVFVVFTWLARWLRHQGYDVTLVHNIDDVNDKIYEAAPGRSAGLARRDRLVSRGHRGLRAFGMPDAQPPATETVPEIVELIGALIESGHAYAADGDVYFRVASFEGYGALSASGPIRSRSRSRTPRRRIRATSRSGRRPRTTRTPSWESPWGVDALAGTSSARQWPRRSSARSSGSTAAGSTSSSCTTRTSAAQSVAAGHPFARIWMHNGMLRFTGEKMSKSLGNVETIREVLDEWGRDGARLLPHRALAEADRLLAGDHAGRPRAGRAPSATRCGANADCGRLGRARRGARGRLQHARRPRGDARMGAHGRAGRAATRGLELFGLESLGAVQAAPAEVVALCGGPGGRQGREGLRRGRSAPRRDRGRREVRDVPARRFSSS